MRYMILLKAAEHVGAPPPPLLAAMAAGIGELMQEGVMRDAGALLPSTAGSARVRLTGERVGVTHGPFTEATELVGGYSVVEVTTHEQAVDLAVRLVGIHKDHWPGWQGEAEVRRMVEPG